MANDIDSMVYLVVFIFRVVKTERYTNIPVNSRTNMIFLQDISTCSVKKKIL